MSEYTVAAAVSGQVAANDKTLVANAVDSVTFDEEIEAVEVLTDGSAAVYFTVDGSVPTVSGQHCFKIPATGAATSLTVWPPSRGLAEVQLISTGTPTYSVTRVA